MTVKYSPTGSAIKWTDYRTEQGSAPDSDTISSGASSVTVAYYAVDDALVEGSEFARLTLVADAAYQFGTLSEAVIYLEDNDPPSGPRL